MLVPQPEAAQEGNGDPGWPGRAAASSIHPSAPRHCRAARLPWRVTPEWVQAWLCRRLLHCRWQVLGSATALFWAGVGAAGDEAQPAPALGTRAPRRGVGAEGKHRGNPGPAVTFPIYPVK